VRVHTKIDQFTENIIQVDIHSVYVHSVDSARLFLTLSSQLTNLISCPGRIRQNFAPQKAVPFAQKINKVYIHSVYVHSVDSARLFPTLPSQLTNLASCPGSISAACATVSSRPNSTYSRGGRGGKREREIDR